MPAADPAAYAQSGSGSSTTAPTKAGPTAWDKVKGNWNIAKGKVKEQWGKLTDDDITMIEGRRDVLVGRLQERYGYSKADAERRVSRWERGFKS
ncbi:MAG: CsbD family protein [Alphaproteobacteria bacterium]|nr:CsbD family protein [Alphaproteobacteria bacterium]